MSLIDVFLKRRPKSLAYRPTVEVLETRVVPSVAVPTGFKLTALSSTQVKLSWNDVTGELGYNLYRWDGTKSVLFMNLPKDSTSFTVTGLQPSTTQWFSMAAVDQSTSAQTGWLSIMTPAQAITAPTNFRVVGVTNTQINLAWNAVSSATGYRVYSWDGIRANLVGSTTPSVPAFTVSNLTPGRTYYFYIQAFNTTNSANTAWLTAATTSANITAPTNVKATALSASTIALSWTDVVSETGYRIYQWDGVTANTQAVIATLAANTTGYQVLGLLPGRTYWYFVQAFNGTNSANSAWVNAQTMAALPLQPPTQLLIEVTGSNSVYLSWVEPARAVGYQIAQWTNLGWTPILTVPAGTHRVPITGLPANQTTWFMIKAYTDNFAEIAYSNAVFVNL
ncbi:MAG: fibronectin type III domain-containing protein [Planctomycetes bacterium]|nr:fibronectin type III domain-containing protein [Planctomycetota bacterium]